MPNWCYNRVIVTATDPRNFQKFKATLNKPDAEGKVVPFSFHQTCPRPVDADWYQWNSSNWGTKWDAGDVELEISANKVTIDFTTAWCPPYDWVDYVAVKFDLIIELRYDEDNENLHGTILASKNWYRETVDENYDDGNSDDGTSD